MGRKLHATVVLADNRVLDGAVASMLSVPNSQLTKTVSCSSINGENVLSVRSGTGEGDAAMHCDMRQAKAAHSRKSLAMMA